MRFIQNQKLSNLPWKEVMLGEGLLNLFLGVSALMAANLFSEPAYNFLHSLSYSDVQNLLLLMSKGILSFSLLSIAIPFLYIAITKSLQNKKAETHHIANTETIKQLD